MLGLQHATVGRRRTIASGAVCQPTPLHVNGSARSPDGVYWTRNNDGKHSAGLAGHTDQQLGLSVYSNGHRYSMIYSRSHFLRRAVNLPITAVGDLREWIPLDIGQERSAAAGTRANSRFPAAHPVAQDHTVVFKAMARHHDIPVPGDSPVSRFDLAVAGRTSNCSGVCGRAGIASMPAGRSRSLSPIVFA